MKLRTIIFLLAVLMLIGAAVIMRLVGDGQSSQQDGEGELGPEATLTQQQVLELVMTMDYKLAADSIGPYLDELPDEAWVSLLEVSLTYAELDRLAQHLWEANYYWASRFVNKDGYLLDKGQFAILDQIDRLHVSLRDGQRATLPQGEGDGWRLDAEPAERLVEAWNNPRSLVRALWSAASDDASVDVRQQVLTRATGEGSVWGEDPGDWLWVWGHALLAENQALAGEFSASLATLGQIDTSPRALAIKFDHGSNKMPYVFPSRGYLKRISRAYHVILLGLARDRMARLHPEKDGELVLPGWIAYAEGYLTGRFGDLAQVSPAQFGYPGNRGWQDLPLELHGPALFAGAADPYQTAKVAKRDMRGWYDTLGLVSSRNRVGDTIPDRNDSSATIHLFTGDISFPAQRMASVGQEGTTSVAVWAHRLVNRWNYQTASEHLIELARHGFPVQSLADFSAFTQAIYVD